MHVCLDWTTCTFAVNTAIYRVRKTTNTQQCCVFLHKATFRARGCGLWRTCVLGERPRRKIQTSSFSRYFVLTNLAVRFSSRFCATHCSSTWRLDVVVWRNRSWTTLCRLYAAMVLRCTPVTTVMDSQYEPKCVIFVLTYYTAIFTTWSPLNNRTSRTTTSEYGIFSFTFHLVKQLRLLVVSAYFNDIMYKFSGLLGEQNFLYGVILLSAFVMYGRVHCGWKFWRGVRSWTGRWLFFLCFHTVNDKILSVNA